VHWGVDKEVKASSEDDLEQWPPDLGLLLVTILKLVICLPNSKSKERVHGIPKAPLLRLLMAAPRN